MITYSKRNGNLQFWISGFKSVKSDWLLATSNLPFTKNESGEILPVQIGEEEKPKSIMLKAILEVAREQGTSPMCAKVTIRQDGTANIVMYDVIGKQEATELMDFIPEKVVAALDKYGFDIQRSACFNGFPENKVAISENLKKVFDAYGIDVAQYVGVEIPLETEEDIRKKAAARKAFKSQKKSLSQLGDFFTPDGKVVHAE